MSRHVGDTHRKSRRLSKAPRPLRALSLSPVTDPVDVISFTRFYSVLKDEYTPSGEKFALLCVASMAEGEGVGWVLSLRRTLRVLRLLLVLLLVLLLLMHLPLPLRRDCCRCCPHSDTINLSTVLDNNNRRYLVSGSFYCNGN